jgi:oligopeptidase B
MSSSPPVAPARPDQAGTDPYAWMRNATDPALLEYLAAERAYYDQQTAPTAAVREELTAEMSARVSPAAESVSWRHGNFAYFTRTVAGLEYEQFCRRRAVDPAAEQEPGAEMLFDQNLLLQDPECRGGYVELGVREVSPDGALLAYSVDFDGDEVYQLRIRDLASGTDTTTVDGQPERIGRTYYGLAWSADSRSLFYVVTNAAYRAYQVWRHDIGTDPAQDVLVFTEQDERFDVIVRATRSGAYILLETESRDTTETLVIPATDPHTAPVVLRERRTGMEYRADHADGPGGGEFYLVTNDEVAEFRLVRSPVPGPGHQAEPDGWHEVIAGAAGTRLVSCHVFGRSWWWNSGGTRRPSCASSTGRPGRSGSLGPPGPRWRWRWGSTRSTTPPR